jgi:hypothetical protein
MYDSLIVEVMQVIFGLPDTERIIRQAECTLLGHNVAGCLYLVTSNICFSSIAAATKSSLFGSGRQADVAIVYRLSSVTAMAKAFANRSRSLVLTLIDKSQVCS